MGGTNDHAARIFGLDAVAETSREPAIPADAIPADAPDATATSQEPTAPEAPGGRTPAGPETPETPEAPDRREPSRPGEPDSAEASDDAAASDDTTASGGGLSERDLGILDFERLWWKHAGAKERAVRDRFGCSPTRYYQALNSLLDRPEALAHDPVLVQRLRRLRAARQRARSTTVRRPGT